MPSTPTSAPASPPGVRSAAFPLTRWPRTRHPDTRRRSRPTASAASRPAGAPEMATTEDRTLEGPHGPLVVRVYEPSAPARTGLVWLHGGGFAGGDLDMPEADWVARQFAE